MFLENNNEANRIVQNISLSPKKKKKKSHGYSAFKGLQSNTMTKNPIFHNLKQNKMRK